MYLAIADNKITQKQNYIKLINNRIIQDFQALPFWKRWLNEDNARQEIRENWKNFEIWLQLRIARKSIINNNIINKQNYDG